MVSREIVMGTIKRMSEAGVDSDTIKSTLIDIGLSDDEITGYMREAGLVPVPVILPAEEAVTQAPEEEILAEREEEPTEEAPEETGSFSPESRGSSEETDVQENIAQRTAEKIAPQIDSLREEQGLRDTTAKLDLEEHKRKLDGIDAKLEGVNKTMPKQAHTRELTIRLKALEDLTAEIQRDITEIKASSNALESLLKKVLETNRKIVMQTSKK